jgi:LuxR family maltose regulon positive regulatory protein
LSLTPAEAASLLRAAGLALGDEDVAELHLRTEGWSAGLYLAALCLRDGGSLPGAAVTVGGDDRFISDYIESELLANLPSRDRVFLTRTAVLERMSGPLCEAVLELPGSGAVLAELARSNLLLVPLDHRGGWYRYHHLFRDMLRAELERLEPVLIPVLLRRAATWCRENAMAEVAMEYSMAAGDVDTAARLMQELCLPAFRQARVTTLQRWFEWLEDRGGIERYPMVAVWASLLAVTTGQPVDAERWAGVVDRWQYGDAARPEDPVIEGWAAVIRAILCRRGVRQMGADADEAVRQFAAAGVVAPIAQLLQGIALVLGGDPDSGDASFGEAFSIGEGIGAPDVLAYTLAERSLLAMARGDWDQAEAFAVRARTVISRGGPDEAFVCGVHARVALHRGDVAAARQDLISAQRLRPLLTYVTPHLAVQTRIELIRVHLALADVAGARTLMQEIDELLKRRPGLGTLVSEAQALRARLAAERGSRPGASALTAAELRLLPLLATHLPVPEIAAELFVAPSTIKSQLKSIYRKLDASNRSQAVTQSRELGLLEG